MEKNFSLVQQYKDAGKWEAMDPSLKAFAEGLDITLKALALSKVDASDLTEKLTEHQKGLLTPEQKAAFAEMETSVKDMAGEMQKLKDQGFKAHEVLPFGQAFAKAIEEKATEIKAIKGNEKASVTLDFKAAAVMTSGNVSANTVANMPGSPATIMPGLASAPRNEPFILDFVDSGMISTPNIQWFNKVNRENGTAMVAENGLKPLSDFDIVGETSTVKKIAHAFNVSEESLTDIPMMQSEINGEGITSLKLGIEDQILNGDGTGNNLKGILAYAGGYSLPALNNTTMSANEYDVILAVNTMLQSLNEQANAIFVNPVTRYKLRTIKDSNNNYVIPPSADANALNIDGLPVIAKNQITAGNFLMGNFKKSHVRFLMDISVRIGYSGDDFRYNRVTFVMEARLTHFIKDVETAAFVEDSFDTVKAALETA